MFKKAGFVAALVLVLSSGVMAAEETVIEKTWKQQIPTAHMQYDKGHGHVGSWVGMNRSMNDQLNETYEKLGHAGLSVGYGLLENLEVRGFVAGESYENVVSPENNFKGRAYLGSVKGQVYNADGFMVAASGAVSHNAYGGTMFAIDGYTNKVLNDKITLYNNAGIVIQGSDLSGTMTNGLQYLVNDKNAVKAAVNTVYHHQAGEVSADASVALKTNLSDKTNNLLWANVMKNVLNLNNMIETQISPEFLLRGQADMTVINAEENRVSGNIGIDAEKQMGKVTFKGGFKHNLKANDWRIATVNAGIEVDVTKNLELSIQAQNQKYYYPENEGQNVPSVNVSLNYEI